MYLRNAALGLHQKLKERDIVPIIDPLLKRKHKDIKNLLEKMNREELETQSHMAAGITNGITELLATDQAETDLDR